MSLDPNEERSSRGKSFMCVMEEAGTYRKGYKDHNKMKSMITEGIMTVELKHINATTKNDHRAFAMLTNNRDSLKITDRCVQWTVFSA